MREHRSEVGSTAALVLRRYGFGSVKPSSLMNCGITVHQIDGASELLADLFQLRNRLSDLHLANRPRSVNGEADARSFESARRWQIHILPDESTVRREELIVIAAVAGHAEANVLAQLLAPSDFAVHLLRHHAL